ncbi:glycoside hydrolase family 13 protein [Priestia aryabhattai]|uniref:glycoside hydrolase family 13 protein n=1 Tax=Priestia aryabhattai TaxID=412384 RepID=UPI003D2D8AF8
MEKKWWKESVVYQIYPISFKDSNGDGIGDLQGIISKLDYLKELGIEVIWLCPIYQSPNHDNGYDISDYRAIMKEFGTMEDFDELLTQAHKRNLKIIMDLVVNHTSDEHPWFIESRSSIDNPKRDYYIWRKGKNGGPPNNWESYFGGSVWEYDERTDEYYLHLYTKQQPDLNWDNKNVIREVEEMVSWWLDKGVDGFRLDAIAHIVKAENLPDAPNPTGLPYVRAYKLFSNLEKVHTLLRNLYEEVLYKYDIMTVGETSGLGPEQALNYIGDKRHELNMVFHFEHMLLDSKAGGTGKWEFKPWNLLDLKNVMSKWQTIIHNQGWNANYLCNHDQPRSVSRFGNDGKYRKESAKMLATFLLTLEGTPYIFQGEEIGMTNPNFPSIEDYRDIETLNYYKEAMESGASLDSTMKAIWRKSRDNSRTPMQWDDTHAAGFTQGTPWMKINANYKEINVQEALQDKNSIFHYYRKMIALRKKHDVLIYGEYNLLLPIDPDLYVYTRTLGEEKFLIILNFFDRTPMFEMPEELSTLDAKLLISNYDVEREDLHGLKLQPYESRIYKLQKN